MKRFLSIVLLTLSLMGTVPGVVRGAGEDAAFLTGIEDLPLMAGLHEDAERALVFESSGGRYVEAYALGAGNITGALAFYDAVLPQLGWRRISALSYSREGENLSMEITTQTDRPGDIVIHFVLSPE